MDPLLGSSAMICSKTFLSGSLPGSLMIIPEMLAGEGGAAVCAVAGRSMPSEHNAKRKDRFIKKIRRWSFVAGR